MKPVELGCFFGDLHGHASMTRMSTWLVEPQTAVDFGSAVVGQSRTKGCGTVERAAALTVTR